MSANVINEIEKLRNSGQTWEDIGDLIGVSGALIWKIAHGYCESKQVTRFFCPPEKRYRRCAEFTAERVEMFDEMLESLDMSFTEYANMLLDEYVTQMSLS